MEFPSDYLRYKKIIESVYHQHLENDCLDEDGFIEAVAIMLCEKHMHLQAILETYIKEKKK